MGKRILTVSEARRRLPQLIQEVARGGGPFYVGPRGRSDAVLVSVEQYELRGAAGVVSESLGAWEPLRVQILGAPADLVEDIREMRRDAAASAVASWDRVMAPEAPKRKRSRARGSRG